MLGKYELYMTCEKMINRDFIKLKFYCFSTKLKEEK